MASNYLADSRCHSEKAARLNSGQYVLLTGPCSPHGSSAVYGLDSDNWAGGCAADISVRRSSWSSTLLLSSTRTLAVLHRLYLCN